MNNRLEFLILKILVLETAFDKKSAVAIKELPLEDLSCGLSMIQKTIKKLHLNGFVAEGLKSGNSKTYYITELGQKILEEI